MRRNMFMMTKMLRWNRSVSDFF